MSRKQRVVTALFLAPLPILAVLFLPTPWLAAFVAAVLLAGLWEWTRFAGLADAPSVVDRLRKYCFGRGPTLPRVVTGATPGAH